MLRDAARNDFYRGGALSLIEDYLRRQGRKRELAAVESQLWQHQEDMSAAQTERSSLLVTDSFVAHGLSAKELESWRAHVRKEPRITKAYLVRKVMKHLQHDVHYVLAVEVKVPWYRRTEPFVTPIRQAILKDFPANGWALVLNLADKPLRRK